MKKDILVVITAVVVLVVAAFAVKAVVDSNPSKAHPSKIVATRA